MKTLTIQSKVSKSNNKKIIYPCLMVYCPDKSNLIKEKFTVLFSESGRGTIVGVDFSEHLLVGFYYNDWIMDNFIPARARSKITIEQN